jgi:tetratricopeptide (TPR) repeat protein
MIKIMKPITFITLLIFRLCFSVPAFSQNDDFKSLSEKGNNYLIERNVAKALEYFEKAVSMGTDDPNDLIWICTIAGISAQQADEPLKALSFFQVAIDANCKDQDVYDRFLKIAEQLKDREKQEYLLLKAHENGLNNRRYLNMLVNFYYQAGQYDKTIRMVDELLQIIPKRNDLLTIKAVSLEMTNQFDQAISIYEEILIADPNNKTAVSRLGMAYYVKANMIYDSARADYMKIKNPTKDQYAVMTKKFDEASVFYQKAIPFLERATPEKQITDALSNSKIRIRNAEKANVFN